MPKNRIAILLAGTLAVVLGCLVPTSLAAASPTIKVTVDPTTLARGGTSTYSPVTYEVAGAVEWEYYAYEPTIRLEGSPPGTPASWFHPEEPRGGVIPGHLYEEKGTYEVCVGVDVLNAIPPVQVSRSCTSFVVIESTAEAVAKEEASRQKKEEEAAKVKAEEDAKQAQEEAARREAENKAQEAQRAELERDAAIAAQEDAARTAAQAAEEAAAKAAKEAKEAAEPCNHETDCPAPWLTASLTRTQKLAKALKQCKKLKNHNKRVTCEKRAKRRYR